MISKALIKRLQNRTTDDYQGRGPNYPKSYAPDTINLEYSTTYCILSFSFKNTDESSAKSFVQRFIDINKENFKIPKKIKQTISAYQDGDYQDDWVVCNFTLRA